MTPEREHPRARLGKVERALNASHPKGGKRGEVRVRTRKAMTAHNEARTSGKVCEINLWNALTLCVPLCMKPGPAPEIGEKKPGPALNHSGNRVDGSFAAPLLRMTAESRDRHTD